MPSNRIHLATETRPWTAAEDPDEHGSSGFFFGAPRFRPPVLMVGVELAGVLDAAGVRRALATALFRDGLLSLPRAARLAELSVSELATRLSRLGIPVVALDANEAERDMETLGAWLASS